MRCAHVIGSNNEIIRETNAVSDIYIFMLSLLTIINISQWLIKKLLFFFLFKGQPQLINFHY